MKTVSSLFQTYLNHLKRGKILAYPTETVWGLGVDALNKGALESLYALKKRERDKPVSLLVRNLAKAKELAFVSSSVEKLIQVFCPGPFTFVLPLRDKSLMHVCGGRDFISLRFSSHPFVTRLVWSYPNPITTTSMNLSGKKEPFSIQDLERHSKDVLLVKANYKYPERPIKELSKTASAVIQINEKNLTFLREGLLSSKTFLKIAHSLGFESM